ncbi:MAG TPA: hypothetical protein VKV21_01365 [Solirubrobacteraceae bacterium]|nr:hypothetical protein [Solirubrobacteraceae bacterium]
MPHTSIRPPRVGGSGTADAKRRARDRGRRARRPPRRPGRPHADLFFAIAAILAFGGRSESIRAFRGDLSDERLRAIELRAVAFAGRLTILAAVIGMIVEIARGHSGAPFTWLGAIGGASYLDASVYGMRR